MTDRQLWRNPWFRSCLFGAFWTLVGLSFASQFYIASTKAGINVTWGQAVSSSLGDWYVFALLSWPAVRLARLFPFEGPLGPASLLVHLPASLLFSLLYILLRAGVAVAFSWVGGPPTAYLTAFRPLLVKTWYFNLMIYWVIFAVGQAFSYYRKYQERELRAVELERRLTEAKLQALRMQLNPHFLFNTLHAISSLMHRDVEAADRMIARLSDLLRLALDASDQQEVTLEHELRFLQDYLVIEQTRFGDRLSVSFDVQPGLGQALVPNLVLQPLVENAILHGIEPQAKPGRVDLLARRENGELLLEVRDNGRGVKNTEDLEGGVGVSNTRARLEQLYGSDHRLSFANAPEGGLVVRIVIPFRVATPHAS